MTNWAIVAIPEKDDPVWKISSEKIPHMTILSLGDHEADPISAKILGYMEHAIEVMLHRFSMSVDRRGTLGPQDADVLFFEESNCDREIKKFRDSLLKDPDILEWYNSSPQFDGWTPHLTLGFPETPAHPDDREWTKIYSVGFDKIALWMGDFDGPEFELQNRQWNDLEMADIQESLQLDQKVVTADMLQARPHIFDESKVKRGFGGKFAAKAESSKPALEGGANPKDHQWLTPDAQAQLDSKISDLALTRIAKASTAVAKKYGLGDGSQISSNPAAMKEMTNRAVKIGNTFAVKVGVSPSGTQRIEYYVDSTGSMNHRIVKVSGAKKVAHIDIPGISLDQVLSKKDIEQSGVLGQKWGVRRDRSGGVSNATVRVDNHVNTKGLGHWQASVVKGNAKSAKRLVNFSLPRFNRTYFAQNPPKNGHTMDRKELDLYHTKLIGHVQQVSTIAKTGIWGHPQYSGQELSIHAAITASALMGAFVATHDDMVEGDQKILIRFVGRADSSGVIDNFDVEIDLNPTNDDSDLMQSDVLDGISLDQKISDLDLTQANSTFDESKVNRGHGGKFAKKADTNGDADWMDPANLRAIHEKILEAATAELTANKAVILKKYGLKPGTEITQNPKAQKELLTSTVAILNSHATKIGVSPSGGARINFAVNKAGTGIYKSAVLNNDAHRVGGHLASPVKHSFEDLGINLEQILTEEDIEQSGTRGMKWGVRHVRGAGGLVTKRVASGHAARKTQRKEVSANRKAIAVELAKHAEITRRVKKSGIASLSNNELSELTKRINLQASYAEAVGKTGKIKSFNQKAQVGIDLGKKVNAAIEFGSSAAGQLLLSKISPEHAAKAIAISNLSKKAQEAKAKIARDEQTKQEKQSKKNN